MSADELKPCPFCEGKATVQGGLSTGVCCGSCGANIQSPRTDGMIVARRHSAELWNTRHGDDRSNLPILDEVRDALEGMINMAEITGQTWARTMETARSVLSKLPPKNGGAK